MITNLKSVFLCFFAIPASLFAQNKYAYSIDTSKILSNENLGYFIQKLNTDSFVNFSDIKAIPLFIKKQLNSLTGKFSIANPSQEYRCCCTSPNRLPERKLLFLAKSKNILAMTYLTGGWGVATHLLLIKFEQNKIVDLWTGYCPNGINSVNDIVNYISEIKDKKGEFNTNLIDL